MIVTFILLLLVLSFLIHVLFVVLYVSKKSQIFFKGFIASGLTNVLVMGVLSFVAVKKPHLIQEVNIAFLLWCLSGVVLVVTIIIKVSIFTIVFRRSKNPEYFHVNYFGKKVYNKKILKPSEFMTMVGSFPFFIIIGAYFIAKLVNYIRFGYL